MTPAELIAQNLASLPHPDGTPRVMPGFNSQLLPDPLQEQVTQNAKELGEAIIYLLESSGYHIGTEAPPTPVVKDVNLMGNVHCNVCDTRLFQLNMTNPQKILTNPHMLIGGISSINPDCPHAPV